MSLPNEFYIATSLLQGTKQRTDAFGINNISDPI